MRLFLFCLPLLLAWTVACATPSQTNEAPLVRSDSSRLQATLDSAIVARVTPGLAVVVGDHKGTVYAAGHGTLTYEDTTQVDLHARYDLASLTKVVATTTAVMLLHEEGRLALDTPVTQYLPSFVAPEVTVHHLLAHTSGLPAYRPFHREGFTTAQAVRDAVLATQPLHAPGRTVTYSDFNMILLAWVVQAVTGEAFASYVSRKIFKPLGMNHTGFRPQPIASAPLVPTEVDTTFRQRLLRGEVHDETAWLLGGVAGHAGLFGCAADLSRFADMLIHNGQIGETSFLQPETIRRFTTPPDSSSARALGWDLRSAEGYTSAGDRMGPQSYGHTGFTGTSLWIDPEQQAYVLLLTNRVHPSRSNRGHVALRPRVATLGMDLLERHRRP